MEGACAEFLPRSNRPPLLLSFQAMMKPLLVLKIRRMMKTISLQAITRPHHLGKRPPRKAIPKNKRSLQLAPRQLRKHRLPLWTKASGVRKGKTRMPKTSLSEHLPAHSKPAMTSTMIITTTRRLQRQLEKEAPRRMPRSQELKRRPLLARRARRVLARKWTLQ